MTEAKIFTRVCRNLEHLFLQKIDHDYRHHARL